MAAAEYYGYGQDYGDDPHRTRGEHSRSPVSPLHEHPPPGIGLHLPSTPSSFSTPTSTPTHSTTPYPPQASNDSLYGGGGADTSYNHHQRDSTASVATLHNNNNNKLYSDSDADPYAENIPLHTRRPSMPPSSTSTPPLPPLPPPKHRPASLSRNGTRKPRPWFCWLISILQASVFIAEIARNATLTGSPIAIKPSFNPMIGPSPYVLINMGGRYVLCMQYQADLWTLTPGVPITGPVLFPCPSTTKNDAQCTLAQHCGFSGVPSQAQMMAPPHPGPNQWYRFILPMFLHAGLIHIAFNLLLQLRLGVDMEREIGPLRFALVYFSAGIFGFILGGNFAPRGVVSTGASGCLFGILALVLLDLFYTWNERLKPWNDLAWLMVDIVISFVLGLLPGLDNFAHIGGFVMGLMLGLTVLRSPAALRRRIGESGGGGVTMSGGRGGGGRDGIPVPYSPVYPPAKRGGGPAGFFRGRRPAWWVWWGVRAGTLACAVVATSVLLRWFYVSRVECGWCKYLSCLPVSNWCEIGEIRMASTNGTAG